MKDILVSSVLYWISHTWSLAWPPRFSNSFFFSGLFIVFEQFILFLFHYSLISLAVLRSFPNSLFISVAVLRRRKVLGIQKRNTTLATERQQRTGVKKSFGFFFHFLPSFLSNSERYILVGSDEKYRAPSFSFLHVFNSTKWG